MRALAHEVINLSYLYSCWWPSLSDEGAILMIYLRYMIYCADGLVLLTLIGVSIQEKIVKAKSLMIGVELEA